ncbi:MAG: N-acetylmuramoyl-L-alanine amidase [Parachlamydiales bacterium]|nr:N-acetylmuramoyl-L-alanine amidase [Parachlamydiales bacterium]
MFLRLLFVLISLSFSLSANPKKIVAAAYNNKTIKTPVIVIDAGHGGLDKGAKIKTPYIEEKKACLTTALITKKYLEQKGYKVILTRSKDYFVPPKKRADIANDLKAELFVSIHFNSCPNKAAHGVEVFYFNSKEDPTRTKHSKNLAHSALSYVCQKTNAKVRSVKKADFCVIRETKMPAILVEGGFITNAKERENLRKKEYLEKISLGIAEGIENFIKKYI